MNNLHVNSVRNVCGEGFVNSGLALLLSVHVLCVQAVANSWKNKTMNTVLGTIIFG